MSIFLLRRIGRLLTVLVVVSFLSMVLIDLLPGDPTNHILGPTASAEAREAARAELGLDRPLPVRYLSWVSAAVTGDLGMSYVSNVPVADLLAERLPVTVQLLVMAQLSALAAALPAGMLAATRADRAPDRAVTTLSLALAAVPVFVVGVALVWLFAVTWRLLPATGYVPFSEDPAQNLRTMVLPTVTVAVGGFAIYARLLRTELISTLQEDYIALARARGFSRTRILWRHALRPSVTSVVTVMGLAVGSMIGGAVIVEVLFGLPGVGRLIIDSITARDYLVIQGGVLLVAVGFVVANLLVDVAYALIDPRVRRA